MSHPHVDVTGKAGGLPEVNISVKVDSRSVVTAAIFHGQPWVQLKQLD